MQYRTFGRTGWQASEIGYGMWGMGGWSGSDDAESLASLHRAVEGGCTFYDTALAYGVGHSERLLGQVGRAHPDRGLVVATKVPPKNRQWPSNPGDRIRDVFPPDYVLASVQGILRQLKMESLDLVQFHVWQDAWADDEGWQRAAEDVRSQGLARHIGISVMAKSHDTTECTESTSGVLRPASSR